jgi:hypothetical protein
MKSIIVIALLGCTVVSCKKTYQCQCTEIYNYETWNPIITNVAIENKTKDDATAICNSLAFDLGNGNYKTTELK